MSLIRSSSVVTAAVLCCLAMPVQAQQSLKERVTSYAVSCKDSTVSLASRASSATKNYASRGANKVSSLASCAKDKVVVWGGAAKSLAQKRRVQQVAIGGGVLLIAGGLGYYFRENVAEGFALSRKQVASLWASLGIFGGAHSLESSGSDEQGQIRSVVTTEDSNAANGQDERDFADHAREFLEQGKEKANNLLSAIGAKARELKERAAASIENLSDNSDDDGEIPFSEQ